MPRINSKKHKGVHDGKSKKVPQRKLESHVICWQRRKRYVKTKSPRPIRTRGN